MPTSTNPSFWGARERLQARGTPPLSDSQPACSLRVLLLSNARPSRTWRLALRVTQEIAGAAICGIVQRPLRELPVIQQRIADRDLSATRGPWSRATHWIQAASEELMHWALWCVHGCPPGLRGVKAFTVATLAGECAAQGWPLRETVSFNDQGTLEFIRQAAPDLVLLVGQAACAPDLRAVPRRGVVRILETSVPKEPAKERTALQVTVEHVAGPASELALASLTLPLQPEDGPLGFSLKTDLIEDDLLVEAAAALKAGGAVQAAERVSQWVKEILSPYLGQLPAPVAAPQAARRAFCRSRLRLSLGSTLLVSPFVLGRNWLRRWRGRCPVLILAYHLVSDRGHRMGISTERFWRQVRFLQRHYRIVSLAEAVRLLGSGNVAAPAVCLTFDDGYADNFVSLRAVASEAGIPVSIFLTTRPVSLHTEFQHDVAKGERGAFPLSWDQVRYWGRRGAEFGGHTRTHVNCGTSQATVLREELRGAREDLERELGAPVTFFAFPYGQRDSMSEEARRVAQSTYAHFLSSYGGENVPNGAGNHAHLLRKPAYTEPWELELDLQSVFDLIGKAKRWFRPRVGPAPRQDQPGLLPAAASLPGGLTAHGQELKPGYEVSGSTPSST